MKTFTLDEAQSLLPLLESLLKRAIEGKQAAEAAEADLSALAQRIYVAGGMRVDVEKVSKQRAEVEGHLQRVRETACRDRRNRRAGEGPGSRVAGFSLPPR